MANGSPKCFAQTPRAIHQWAEQTIRARFSGRSWAKHSAARFAVNPEDYLPNALHLRRLDH
jgi:hypothetical protein